MSILFKIFNLFILTHLTTLIGRHMKSIIPLFILTALLAGCSNTHVGINANNNGVFGAIGSSVRW